MLGYACVSSQPAPGPYTITFSYDEQEAHGFVPEQPRHVAAPPIKLDVP